MRWTVLIVCILLAGCSAKETSSDVEPTDDVSDPEAPDDPLPVEDANVTTRAEVLLSQTVELTGSVATGQESQAWTMGVRMDVTLPSDDNFTGVLLEIHWGAPTGGVAGGTAGLWAQDLPGGATDAKTLGVAEAMGGESGQAWVDAETLLAAETPEFTVAAADGPHHALYGTATVAVTAFFDGEPTDDYTAL